MNAAYKFCYQPLDGGVQDAMTISEGVANALGHQGWMLEHVAMNGSFLLLVFKRAYTPTPPHRTTDRGTPYDTPTTC